MSSLPIRIAVLALVLIQVSVWSVVAPLHRLMHHTLIESNPTDQANGTTSIEQKQCGQHNTCCHHSPHKTATNKQHKESSQSSSQTPNQCPDDSDHCLLCSIAIQSVDCSIRNLEIASQFTVEALIQFHSVAPIYLRVCGFDIRGPPSQLI